LNDTEKFSLYPEYWDVRLERNKFFSKLRSFREDLIKENPEAVNIDVFSKVLLERYGVKIYLEGVGISPRYDVVDQAAFTMFVLKYDR
jgi:hypothetical protein